MREGEETLGLRGCLCVLHLRVCSEKQLVAVFSFTSSLQLSTVVSWGLFRYLNQFSSSMIITLKVGRVTLVMGGSTWYTRTSQPSSGPSPAAIEPFTAEPPGTWSLCGQKSSVLSPHGYGHFGSVACADARGSADSASATTATGSMAVVFHLQDLDASAILEGRTRCSSGNARRGKVKTREQ